MFEIGDEMYDLIYVSSDAMTIFLANKIAAILSVNPYMALLLQYNNLHAIIKMLPELLFLERNFCHNYVKLYPYNFSSTKRVSVF
jgi:hypothetical protein